MSRRIPRPYGVALWGLRRALVESAEDLDEVKIVGVRDGKIYVWKQVDGKDPYVARISAAMISDPKHAPYLIDPPEGTEAEGPAVGDIGDPAKFSGNLPDIKKIEPDKEVPGLGGEETWSPWLPSKKLAMLAKKFKELGLKPQNTFSKAVAAEDHAGRAWPQRHGVEARCGGRRCGPRVAQRA